MSDMGLEEPDMETPDADAAEQHRDLTPEPDANDDATTPADVAKLQLEVDAADAAEQARVVVPDDDEYR
jgi:hypothetical protein